MPVLQDDSHVAKELPRKMTSFQHPTIEFHIGTGRLLLCYLSTMRNGRSIIISWLQRHDHQ